MYFRIPLYFGNNPEKLTLYFILRCVTSHNFLHISYIFSVLIHLVTQWKFHWEGFIFRKLKKSRLVKIWCLKCTKVFIALTTGIYSLASRDTSLVLFVSTEPLYSARQHSLLAPLAHSLEGRVTNVLLILQEKSLCLRCEHRQVRCTVLECQYLKKPQSLP